MHFSGNAEGEAKQRFQAAFFDISEVANNVLHQAEPIQFNINLATKQTEMIAGLQNFLYADAMGFHMLQNQNKQIFRWQKSGFNHITQDGKTNQLAGVM